MSGPETRAGFSLLELMIAMSILSVVGLGLLSAVRMGDTSQQAVAGAVSRNQDLRGANTGLSSELRLAGADSITTTTLGDGNTELTFMQPIVVGTTHDWGVFDPLGATAEEQNKKGWRIRYTVQEVELAEGTERRLVRQVLDDVGDVQESDTVLSGVRSGAEEPRGFSVTPAGDMWEVRVTLEGHSAGSHGQGVEFHVRTRN